MPRYDTAAVAAAGDAAGRQQNRWSYVGLAMLDRPVTSGINYETDDGRYVAQRWATVD